MTPQEAFDKSVRGLASQGFHRAMGVTAAGSPSEPDVAKAIQSAEAPR